MSAISRGSASPVGHRPCQLSLEARGGTEMMQQVGVGPADFTGDRFQRHRLRPALEEDAARGVECGGPAFLRAQAFASY
jgi:hypothetical protein